MMLQARIGSNAFLAVIPDPVTCFSTAKYSQKQVFKVMSDSSLLLVDWITSGRHETGEKWNFDLYRSMNNIFHNDDEPLFLDTVSFFVYQSVFFNVQKVVYIFIKYNYISRNFSFRYWNNTVSFAFNLSVSVITLFCCSYFFF